MGMNTDAVQRLYVAYFNRPADPASLTAYEAMLPTDTAATQAELQAIADKYFSPSAEYSSRYDGKSNADIINTLYNNLFGRDAEPAGLLSWTAKLNSGEETFASIALQLSYSAQGTDADAIAAKISAANAFTTEVSADIASIIGFSGNEAAADSRTWLASVTDSASATSAIAGVAAAVDSSVAAGTAATAPENKSLTLTTAADTGSSFTGGGGDDVFNGVLGATSTLSSGDLLTGGAGSDSLTISATGTGGQTATGFVTSGIETLNVANYTTANTETIDLAQATGITAANLTGSAAAGDTAITNAQAVLDAGMANGTGDLAITHSAAAGAGAADSMTLTLNGATAGGFSNNLVETINVVSDGSAKNAVTVTSTGNTATTVNVSGGAQLTSTITSSALKTVDASAATGKMLLTTNLVSDITVKGGSGDDTLTFTGTTYTKADTVDGGAGSDTLVTGTAITAATDLKNVSNVETLEMTGGADVTIAANANVMTFDFTETGVNVLTLNAGVTGDVTVTVGPTGADSVINTANVVTTINGTNTALTAAGTITGGTKTDTINVTADAGGPFLLSASGVVTLVDQINVIDGGDDAATGTAPAGDDAAITTGAYATALTIDASGMDGATVDSDGDGLLSDEALDEQLTVTGTAATAALTVTGGGGADTIIGGTVNDTLSGGGGDDTITGTAGGNDTINGGDGNDTINMGATLTAKDTIDGGAGSDTLVVTALNSDALSGVSNVETLAFNGTATLSANLSFDTIDLTNGSATDSLTLAAGYTNATTVKVDAGDSIINTGADVALTVTGTATGVATSTITGADKAGVTNTATVTVDGTAWNLMASGVTTNIDTITLVDGGDAATGTSAAGDDITLTLTSYATALTIDASSLDTGTADTNDDGSLGDEATAERLTITGVSGAALTVTGGAADDSIVGSTGNDTLNGGGGADTFTMAATLTYQDDIDGGAGTDIVSVTGAQDDINFMNVDNVETLTMTGTATTNTLGAYFTASGISTVNLSTNGISTIAATGTTHDVTYVVRDAAQNEAITAGQGNDTIDVNGTAVLDGNDVIDGGAGTDTISVNNSAGAVTIAPDQDNVTNVENIVVKNANGGDTAGSENADAISITMGAVADDSTDSADITMSIDASVITDTNDIATISAASVLDPDNVFTITGGAAGDTLTGAAGADTILGGGGADTINGDGGADTLTGGAGADDFVISIASGVSDSNNAGADTITDFVSGTDEIVVTLTPGDGNTYDFTNKGNAADNANALALLSSVRGQFYFNTSTGQYVMDTDGNGLVQSGDLAVTIGGSAGAAADVSINFTDTGGGANTVTTTGGADIITTTVAGSSFTLGAGDDTVNVNVNPTGTIAMGTGTDTLVLGADRDISGGTVSGVEAITLGAATVDITASPAQAATFNSTDGFTITGQSGTVELLKVTATASGSVDVSSITFTNSAASLTGNTGAETLIGGSGADTLTGANGIDTLTGGGGIDTFVYEGIVATANANNVQDFSISGGDIIQLDGAANGLSDGATVIIVNVAGLGDVANQLIVDTAANLGALGASIGNQSGKSNTKHQYAIASDTGAIFYDADGNWTAGSVQIGTIGTQTDTLTAANFTVA